MVNVGDFIMIRDKDNKCAFVKVNELHITVPDCYGQCKVNIIGKMGREFFDSKSDSNRKVVPDYKRVIFAPPATIVYWKDGTRTVVKCDERDVYDAKTGLALCYMKKALGNTSRALNDTLHSIGEKGYIKTQKGDYMEL